MYSCNDSILIQQPCYYAAHLSVGMQRLGQLPNVHQLQAASITQFTNDPQDPASQCSSQVYLGPQSTVLLV